MTSLPRPAIDLSADEARRIALRAQGLLGAPDRRSGVRGRAAASRRGAAGHDLGAGPLPRARFRTPGSAPSAATAVEAAYWTGTARPPGRTPSSTGRTPRASCPSRSGRTSPSAAAPTAPARTGTTTCRTARTTRCIDQLTAEGPLTATELGGAKNGGEWWDWSRREDRRRARADVRRGGLHRAPRLEAGVRPRRARRPGRAAARRPGRRGVPAPPGRPGRRRDGRRPPARTSPTTTASRASRSTRWSRTRAWSR